MLEKIRSGLNLFILFMFAVSVVYGIVAIIINAFTGDKIPPSYITEQNVEIYKTEDNLVTTDYSTFYTIQKCLQDVITTLNNNDVNSVYNILTNEAKAQIGNDKNKLVEYCNNNFKYLVSDDLSTEGYQNYDNLLKLYKLKDKRYICVLTSIDEDNLTNVGIQLDYDNYKIFYIEM